jgi:hypothetical protein
VHASAFVAAAVIVPEQVREAMNHQHGGFVEARAW